MNWVARARLNITGLTASVDYQVQVWMNTDVGTGLKTQIESVPLSDDSSLSALTVADSNGTAIALSPAFDSETLSYSGSAALSVTGVRVTPTAADGTSKITVDGEAVTSGSASQLLALSTNTAKTITLVVTSTSGDQSTYTVTLQRPPSTVRTLAATPGVESLTVSWTAPEFAGTDTTDAEYRIRWRLKTDDDSAAWSPGDNGQTVTATTHAITSLTASVAYQVQVWAQNRGGNRRDHPNREHPAVRRFVFVRPDDGGQQRDAHHPRPEFGHHPRCRQQPTENHGGLL